MTGSGRSLSSPAGSEGKSEGGNGVNIHENGSEDKP